MFTGIVQDKGKIKKIYKRNPNISLEIQSKLSKRVFSRGNSVMVNGVCLTVEKYNPKTKCFIVSLVPETLDKTNFRLIEAGDEVNIESSLKIGDFLSGSFVSGHVDFCSKVIDSGLDFSVFIQNKFLKFFPIKSSITINGVNLTVSSVKKNIIGVSLVPETIKKTNLLNCKSGDIVNIEIDLIAKYLDSIHGKYCK